MGKARNLIEKLERSDEHNIYHGPGTNVENPQRLHRILGSMLQCATDEESKSYATKAILVCSVRAQASRLSDAERRKLLLESLRSLAITWLTKFLFVCE